MRKILGLSLFLFFVVSAIWILGCNTADSSKTAAETRVSDSLQKVIAKGQYLATNVAGCMDCHSKRDFTKYTAPPVPGTEGGGGEVFDQHYGLPGVLYGRNITPDSATGVGSWTDEELIRAITQGISKNGDTLFPLMPYPNFNRMAKEDLLSIVAYIRTLKPIRNEVPKRQLLVPIAAVYPGQFLQPTIDGNARPPETDRVKYGEYLVTLADCGTCHSPLTPHGPDMTRQFAGGYRFDLGTHVVVSPNITPDSATGIGMWTEQMFMEKFTRYRDPAAFNVDSANKNTIMPLSLFAGMKDDDIRAIYAYLRTVKPISNKIEKFPNR